MNIRIWYLFYRCRAGAETMDCTGYKNFSKESFVLLLAYTNCSSILTMVPLVGMGTVDHPFDPARTKSAVLTAIELGYRHFDTAAFK
jgi:hypothetical protein